MIRKLLTLITLLTLVAMPLFAMAETPATPATPDTSTATRACPNPELCPNGGVCDGGCLSAGTADCPMLRAGNCPRMGSATPNRGNANGMGCRAGNQCGGKMGRGRR